MSIASERETVIICDDDSKEVLIYTLQPGIISKLKKVNESPSKVDEWGEGIIINLTFGNSALGKEKREK